MHWLVGKYVKLSILISLQLSQIPILGNGGWWEAISNLHYQSSVDEAIRWQCWQTIFTYWNPGKMNLQTFYGPTGRNILGPFPTESAIVNALFICLLSEEGQSSSLLMSELLKHSAVDYRPPSSYTVRLRCIVHHNISLWNTNRVRQADTHAKVEHCFSCP